jgi:beta-lactam-binding protein with PASTA domain
MSWRPGVKRNRPAPATAPGLFVAPAPEPPPPPGVRGRRLLRDAMLLSGLFTVAFGLAYLALSPGPVIASSHAVPRVLALPADSAERELEAAGFRVRRGEGRLHPLLADGTVIWQDPPAGTVLTAGSTVLLTVSDGLALYPVPDVLQFPAPLARKVVEAAGLRIERVDSVPNRAPRGTVIETRPAPGSARPLGSGVVLVVSATIPTVEAPR